MSSIKLGPALTNIPSAPQQPAAPQVVSARRGDSLEAPLACSMAALRLSHSADLNLPIAGQVPQIYTDVLTHIESMLPRLDLKLATACSNAGDFLKSEEPLATHVAQASRQSMAFLKDRKYEQALQTIEPMLPQVTSPQQRGALLCCRGKIRQNMKQPDKALADLRNSLAEFLKEGTICDLSYVAFQIPMCLDTNGQPAIQDFRGVMPILQLHVTALQKYPKAASHVLRRDLQQNIAMCKLREGDVGGALAGFTDNIKMCEEACDPHGVMMAQSRAAECCMESFGRLDEAESYANAAYSYCEENYPVRLPIVNEIKRKIAEKRREKATLIATLSII